VTFISTISNKIKKKVKYFDQKSLVPKLRNHPAFIPDNMKIQTGKERESIKYQRILAWYLNWPPYTQKHTGYLKLRLLLKSRLSNKHISVYRVPVFSA